jgi:hypothetical protein
MTDAPAGWYDDGNGGLRYWDGAAWTEHTAPSTPPGAPVAPTRRRPVWPWIVAGAAVLVIGLGVGGVFLVTSLVRGFTGEPEVSPGDTVLEYNTAWNTQDCELANSLTTDDLDFDDCADFIDSTSEYTDYSVSVMDQSVSGSTARVLTSESFHVDGDVQVAQYTYLLEKHGGVWQISSIDSDR